MGTPFSAIYDRFLGKITDDMYVELTPEDTYRDLQNLLIDALPGFEFPRCNLSNYQLKVIPKRKDDINDHDFIVERIKWEELDNPTLDELAEELENGVEPDEEIVMVDSSEFNFKLTSEEINIIAILMMCSWVQRQVTSIENTRMKYSGSDFKMTSQANHLQKLMGLLNECQRQSIHMQRLYKRRRPLSSGIYRSNWDVFGRGVYYDRYGY